MADFRETTYVLRPREVVKSSELAYSISSLKSLVAKNLKISYQNLAVYSADSHDFSAAVFFADKVNDEKISHYVFSKEYNFLAEKVKNVMTKKEARKYKKIYQRMLVLAKHLDDKKLIKSINSVLAA